MSLQYDKKKFNTLRDQFYTNPTINPISGKKIQINKVTYNQLVKEFGNPVKSFEFFEQLPEDLQTDIYSRNLYTLKRSPTISKIANKVTKNKLCELNITKKEFLNYIHEVIPHTAYAIPYVTKSKYNITKFLLMIYPSVNTELKYIYNLQLIEKDMNIVTLSQREDMMKVNFDYMSESEYDLLTSYFIYKRRKTCQHIPNYAKNQILKLLKLNQNKNKNTYIDELKWYMYLRTNLSQFPYELPKNEYYDYVITVDDKENITDDTKFMMLQLQEDNNQLYQALLDQINKL